MENYTVEQFNDDIIVRYQQHVFIQVKRKFNWRGKLTSFFIKDGVCVLETTYDIFLFRKYMSIKYQSLDATVSLSEENGIFYLNYDNNKLKSKRHYFRNPLYTLHNNTFKIGEVHTKLTGVTPSPVIYDITFKMNEEVNLYSLLRFLMELPPTMDV